MSNVVERANHSCRINYKLSEKNSGSEHINIPSGVRPDNPEVIVVSQNNQDGDVSAANRTVLEKNIKILN